ncbi:hypothetical protein Peur_023140 [Populus x canadensis]
MGVHLASTLIDESLGMNFQLDLSRYANLSLFFTWFCIPAFSLLHSGVALLEFNLPSLYEVMHSLLVQGPQLYFSNGTKKMADKRAGDLRIRCHRHPKH